MRILPALFGIGTPLAEGEPADLTVFNLNQSYKIDPAFLSKDEYSVCRRYGFWYMQIYNDKREARMVREHDRKIVLKTAASTPATALAPTVTRSMN